MNTGLDYAINRHYDPQQGRFTQVDPIGMGSVSLDSPQTLNLYAYCANDPINHIDPSGLGFISFLKKVLNRVVNALIHAAITVAFTFIFSGGNLGAALVAGVADFLKELGFPTNGFGVKIGGTPQWNPNAVSILSGGPNALSRYIIVNFTQGQDPIYDEVIRTYTLAKGPWWNRIGRGFASLIRTTGNSVVRALSALKDNEMRVIRCFDNNRFSSAVSYATQGSRFHGVAAFVAEEAEILPVLSVGTDLEAISLKGARGGIGGPKQRYASGLNMVIKRQAGRAVLKVSRQRRDKHNGCHLCFHHWI